MAAVSTDTVERELIWHHRDVLTYNNFGKKTAPAERLRVIHQGSSPRFVIPDSSDADRHDAISVDTILKRP
jgi:hypothetical protein